MVENGLGGLLIVMELFAFLSGHWLLGGCWYSCCLPCDFLSAMLVSGQSINMISLFGLIMALGIVVDDAIVIGEHRIFEAKEKSAN